MSILASLCLATRLAFFLLVAPWRPAVADRVILFNDARDYHRLALNLLEHGRYSVEADGPPEALPPPAYPLGVAGLYAFFGPRPWVVLLLQCFLDTSTCLLLHAITRRSFGAAAASWTALFYAVDPALILYSCHLLTDILFVFLLVLASRLLLEGLARDRHGPHAGWIALSGAVFGLAALTRPIGVYAAIPVAFVLFLWHLRRMPVRSFVSVLAFCTAFGASILPWILRNQLVFGTPAFSTSGSYNLLVLDVVPAESARRGQPAGEVRDSLFAEAEQRMARDGIDPASANPFVRAEYWRELALEYARREPALIAKHAFKGMAYMFLNLGTGYYSNMIHNELRPPAPGGGPGLASKIWHWIRDKSKTEIVLALLFGPVLVAGLLCAACGIFAGRRLCSDALYPLCLAFVLYFVLLTGAAGLARFRLPAIPYYLALAGAGAARLRQRFSLNRAVSVLE